MSKGRLNIATDSKNRNFLLLSKKQKFDSRIKRPGDFKITVYTVVKVNWIIAFFKLSSMM